MAAFVKVAGTAAALASAGSDPTPCCAKKCEAPLVKMYSVDAEHGFCGESCMDPAKFDTYKKFEANLTIASPEHDVHPCSLLRTPDNQHRYTDYFDTVTHGVPGVLSVTLDLYAPQKMPNHACCIATLFPSQPCSVIPGKPTSLKIFGTGPFCCPKGATEEKPCGEEAESEGKVALYTPVVAPSKDGPEATPCCANKCEAPLVKMYSVDAEHGFCGESCMDPAKFSTYKRFEANLTIAKEHDLHPCHLLRTPDNSHRYTDYFQTVTHGVPGLLSVTLDLYAPTKMPDHSCCVDTLFPSQPCSVIPGKPTSLKIFGTGPFCCPKGATEESPCGKATESEDEVVEPAPVEGKEGAETTPCCNKKCEAPLVKMYSVDAEHGFCGESCMDPTKFDTYKKFEANLTIASPEHQDNPCSLLRTPDNKHRYTDYFQTVTHGVPGFGVTLDLYAPQKMPNHGCCIDTLFPSQPCSVIPGKPTSLKIFGTGPFCCPKGATEEKPCGEEPESETKAALYTPVAAAATAKPDSTPCCANKCEAPLVKMYSVDAEHGFCGESCMDPAKFSTYKKFEANLTIAKEHDLHPCHLLRTPDNSKRYTDYFQTVTHGVPGLLSVTLDLYAPTEMPDHSCCIDTLFPSQPCSVIPGKPTSLKIFGTGPFCCPKGATAENPCGSNVIVV